MLNAMLLLFCWPLWVIVQLSKIGQPVVTMSREDMEQYKVEERKKMWKAIGWTVGVLTLVILIIIGIESPRTSIVNQRVQPQHIPVFTNTQSTVQTDTQYTEEETDAQHAVRTVQGIRDRIAK